MSEIDPELALKLATNASDVTANILAIKSILINKGIVDQDTYDQIYREIRQKFSP